MKTIPTDAEKALLGACLLSPDAYATAEEMITPQDFALQPHRDIFASMGQLHSKGEPIDPITVAGVADLDPADLSEMMQGSYVLSSVPSYATTIIDARVRREVIFALEDIGNRAHSGATPGAELISDVMTKLMGIETHNTVVHARSIDEFLRDTPLEYDWIIPDFMERGDRCIITGGEGHGKSVLLTQIAMQTASGIHPWTWEDVEPARVLMIDLENGDRRVARRIHSMRRFCKNLDADRLRIEGRRRGINLLGRSDRLWLSDLCRDACPDILIMGPCYRMSSGVASRGDVGQEDMIRTVTAVLDDIRDRFNMAVLLETHAPHGDGRGSRDLRPFGSSVWLRWPEFGIGIAPSDRRGCYDVRHWRGARDERLWPVQLHRESMSWPWVPVLPDYR